MRKRATALEANQTGRDKAPLAFFLVYVLTGVSLWIAWRGGMYTLFAPIAMTFVAVPVLDAVIGVDTHDAAEAPPRPVTATLFRLATWLALPVQATVLLACAAMVTSPIGSAAQVIGACIAAGISGGVIGITVAHELIHRSSRIDRALGHALLVMVCYRHWATEHVAGHHLRVATPEDPATARLGESLPAFMVRSVVGGFRSAWRIERKRNARRGVQSPLRNPVLGGLLVSCGLAAVLSLAFGPAAIIFFLAQSAVAVGFLETVNYIEHYGLERRQLRPGIYERVTPLHSWNSSHWLTNALLFNLQRHSDHHAWPARPYYKLRHNAAAPQLPAGYAGMALLAMVPPLWRQVMDRRVVVHRAKFLVNAGND